MHWLITQKKERVKSAGVTPTSTALFCSEKTYPVNQSTEDPVSREFHTHMSESFKAFQAKTWKPLKEKIPAILTFPAPKCSKDKRRQSVMSKNKLLVPSWTPPSRPRSVLSDNARPCSSNRIRDTSDVIPGTFDSLDPQTLGHLIGPDSPRDFYGERCKTDDNDDVSTTSGVGSDWSILGDEDEEESVIAGETSKSPVPAMRPEQLDAMYIPHKSPSKQYEFDSEDAKLDAEVNEFPNIIPRGFRFLDFSVIGKQNLEWRNLVEKPEAPLIVKLFDRLVEMEKLQNETISGESRKPRSTITRRQPISRSNSARSATRDKRCCSSCLQVACVGDCPEKNRLHCDQCNQPCGGSCTSTYDQHTRHTSMETHSNSSTFQKKTKTCVPCNKKSSRHSGGNSPLLGRPRSSNPTFSSSRHSVKSREIRPMSAVEYTAETLRHFETLGIEVVSSVSLPTSASGSRPKSRNSLLPGKTFSSNRKISITSSTQKSSVSRSRSKSPKLKSLSPKKTNDIL